MVNSFYMYILLSERYTMGLFAHIPSAKAIDSTAPQAVNNGLSPQGVTIQTKLNPVAVEKTWFYKELIQLLHLTVSGAAAAIPTSQNKSHIVHGETDVVPAVVVTMIIIAEARCMAYSQITEMLHSCLKYNMAVIFMKCINNMVTH